MNKDGELIKWGDLEIPQIQRQFISPGETVCSIIQFRKFTSNSFEFATKKLDYDNL